jgi:hypothetical protein
LLCFLNGERALREAPIYPTSARGSKALAPEIGRAGVAISRLTASRISRETGMPR